MTFLVAHSHRPARWPCGTSGLLLRSSAELRCHRGTCPRARTAPTNGLGQRPFETSATLLLCFVVFLCLCRTSALYCPCALFCSPALRYQRTASAWSCGTPLPLSHIIPRSDCAPASPLLARCFSSVVGLNDVPFEFSGSNTIANTGTISSSTNCPVAGAPLARPNSYTQWRTPADPSGVRP